MGRVICAGSINMDVVATADRHPLAGETIAGTSLAYFPGGKGANQAVAAVRMGAETIMLGSVGDDAFGAELRSFLESVGVNVDNVREVAGPTGTALIIVANAENMIVVIPAANGRVETAQLLGHVVAGDVVMSQFEIPVETIIGCFDAAKAAGARTILNTAPAGQIPEALHRVTDVLVLNETELGFLVGTVPTDAESAIDLARKLRHSDTQVVIVTLGAAGAAVVDGAESFAVAGRRVKAVDTTGAGDCFVGALASQLANSSSLEDAIAVANAAASICVTRPGAGPSMPAFDEVRKVLG